MGSFASWDGTEHASLKKKNTSQTISFGPRRVHAQKQHRSCHNFVLRSNTQHLYQHYEASTHRLRRLGSFLYRSRCCCLCLCKLLLIVAGCVDADDSSPCLLMISRGTLCALTCVRLVVLSVSHLLILPSAYYFSSLEQAPLESVDFDSADLAEFDNAADEPAATNNVFAALANGACFNNRGRELHCDVGFNSCTNNQRQDCCLWFGSERNGFCDYRNSGDRRCDGNFANQSRNNCENRTRGPSCTWVRRGNGNKFCRFSNYYDVSADFEYDFNESANSSSEDEYDFDESADTSSEDEYAME